MSEMFGQQFTSPVYRDGYRLLLKSAANTALAVGAPVAADSAAPFDNTLATTAGVMRLESGDGVRIMFIKTGTTTAPTFLITGYEPAVNTNGRPVAYIERPVSGPAATGLTVGTAQVGSALAAGICNMDGTAVAAANQFASTDTFYTGTAALSGNQTGAAVYSPGSNTTGHFDFFPAQGITHIRAYTKADAQGGTIWTIARRLRGDAQR